MLRIKYFALGGLLSIAFGVLAQVGGVPSLLRLRGLCIGLPCTPASDSLIITGDQEIAASRPLLRMTETDASADNGVWELVSNTEAFAMSAVNDAGTLATDFLFVQRTGSNVDSIGLTSDTFVVNAVDMTPATGNSTVSMSGCSTSQTVDVDYYQIADRVFVDLDFTGGCTSNSTGYSTSGTPPLPAPSVSIAPQICGTGVDNTSTAVSIQCYVTSGGHIVMRAGNSLLDSSWTASGTKGFASGSGAHSNGYFSYRVR